jgi:hypothetical protein
MWHQQEGAKTAHVAMRLVCREEEYIVWVKAMAGGYVYKPISIE